MGGHALAEVKQTPILLFYRFRAHRQPKAEPAQVDIYPSGPHNLVRLHAHRAIFGHHDGHYRNPFAYLRRQGGSKIARNVLSFHEIRDQLDYRSVR
jgi:hypothetical protein